MKSKGKHNKDSRPVYGNIGAVKKKLKFPSCEGDCPLLMDTTKEGVKVEKQCYDRGELCNYWLDHKGKIIPHSREEATDTQKRLICGRLHTRFIEDAYSKTAIIQEELLAALETMPQNFVKVIKDLRRLELYDDELEQKFLETVAALSEINKEAQKLVQGIAYISDEISRRIGNPYEEEVS